jgi:hypothetical protein
MDKAADTLVIIWTSRDREVAKNMVFMYAKNSRLQGWWPAVRLVVWGPSAALIAGDAELQAELEGLRQAGVELLACRACAEQYGVAPRLEELGIQVIYMGRPLTEYLQAGLPVLTF